MAKVLIACEESQTVCKAFRALGHEAYSCDIQPPSGGHAEWHIQGDALIEAYSGDYALMIAHPPCTYLSNAGAMHLFAGGITNSARLAKMHEAKAFFLALLAANQNCPAQAWAATLTPTKTMTNSINYHGVTIFHDSKKQLGARQTAAEQFARSGQAVGRHYAANEHKFAAGRAAAAKIAQPVINRATSRGRAAWAIYHYRRLRAYLLHAPVPLATPLDHLNRMHTRMEFLAQEAARRLALAKKARC